MECIRSMTGSGSTAVSSTTTITVRSATLATNRKLQSGSTTTSLRNYTSTVTIILRPFSEEFLSGKISSGSGPMARSMRSPTSLIRNPWRGACEWPHQTSRSLLLLPANRSGEASTSTSPPSSASRPLPSAPSGQMPTRSKNCKLLTTL